MKVALNLLQDNIVVKVDETETTTDNGIILPDTQDDIIVGVVVAYGDIVTDNNIKLGSIVLFKKSSSANFNIFDNKYRLITYNNIIGYIDNKYDIHKTNIIKEVKENG